MRRRLDLTAILGTGALILGVGLIILVPLVFFAVTRVNRPEAPPVLVAEAPEPSGAVPIRLPERTTLAPGLTEDAPEPEPPPPEPAWASGPAGSPQAITIPRIEVESNIVSVRLTRGEWPVPQFVVGHLAETALPGNPGNAVFAGHIQTLTWGNVFSRLKELQVGDDVIVRSADGARRFRVTETRLVRNTDVSIIEPRSGRTTVTLITCEGRWLPREKDYDQRRIVVADAA